MSRRALARPVIGELQANMPTSSRLASRLTSTCPMPPPASRWALMEHSCLWSTHNHHTKDTLPFSFFYHHQTRSASPPAILFHL